MQVNAPEALSTLDGIADRTAVCGVVGLGYVGLPLAVEIARAGFRVLGFDRNPDVVEGVRAGRSHIDDVDQATLSALVGEGLLTATSDEARLADCDVISICVPTPLSKLREPDVSYIVAATDAVARSLRPGQLIVLESTTYPGTTRELMLPALEASGLRAGEDFCLCFSPERVDPGNPVYHTRNTPKVIGGLSERCLEVGTAFYGAFIDTVVPVSTLEAAELTKLLENTFRAVNIAMVNEMAQVADRLNVDIWEVIDAAATKPFGYMRFMPGPGIGGHCIPLDPHYLVWKMKSLHFRTRMIEQASEINSEMPLYVVGRIQQGLNARRLAVNGSRVLIVGVAYKKDVDDVRESPALEIIEGLTKLGADVVFHDPYVPELRLLERTLESVALDEAELDAADCVVIV
ncbi:MAG: nucleotide sugar dehydrogenase, partial [Longimicrobiales bacterium]